MANIEKLFEIFEQERGNPTRHALAKAIWDNIEKPVTEERFLHDCKIMMAKVAEGCIIEVDKWIETLNLEEGTQDALTRLKVTMINSGVSLDSKDLKDLKDYKDS
jgi:hypothetical protein